MSDYVGSELELFQEAVNWKRYWATQVRRYLGPSVLEVGAGLGANTLLLASSAQRRWHCLEPDQQLAQRIEEAVAAGRLPENCSVQAGTIDDLPESQGFDAVIYVDVMEHIEADLQEFSKASKRLSLGGYLVILAPAHQALFSPFDAAIGHYRRYNCSTLRALGAPGDLHLVTLRYLDSVGLAASAVNRVLLKSDMPTQKQIRFWDRLMVPLSRVIDPLTGYTLGKSILGAWQRR